MATTRNKIGKYASVNGSDDVFDKHFCSASGPIGGTRSGGITMSPAPSPAPPSSGTTTTSTTTGKLSGAKIIRSIPSSQISPVTNITNIGTRSKPRYINPLVPVIPIVPVTDLGGGSGGGGGEPDRKEEKKKDDVPVATDKLGIKDFANWFGVIGLAAGITAGYFTGKSDKKIRNRNMIMMAVIGYGVGESGYFYMKNKKRKDAEKEADASKETKSAPASTSSFDGNQNYVSKKFPGSVIYFPTKEVGYVLRVK